MKNRPRLAAQQTGNLRLPVTQRVDGQAAQEIQITFPLVVVKRAAVTAHRQDGQALVGLDQVFLLEFSNLVEVHISYSSGGVPTGAALEPPKAAMRTSPLQLLHNPRAHRSARGDGPHQSVRGRR